MEQNQNISIRRRKDRLLSFFQVSIGGCSLLILLLIALLCPMTGKVFAEEGGEGSSNDNKSRSIPSNVTISFGEPVGNNVVMPSSSYGQVAEISTIVSVGVANSGGYSVYLGMGDPEEKKQAGLPTSSNLVGTSGSEEYVIRSMEGKATIDAIPTNTWGYYYGKSGLREDDALYKAVAPGQGDKLYENNSSKIYSDTRSFLLSFAARIGDTIPADVYSNTVTLSVVSSPLVITMLDIDTMQALTPDICSDTPLHATKRLQDTRDGNLYWVTKLADNNCWMSQNLDLNLDVDKPLTVANGSASDYTPLANTITNQQFGGEIDGVSLTDNVKAYHSWDEGEYVVIQPRVGYRMNYFGMTQELKGIAGYANMETILQRAKTQGFSEAVIQDLKDSGALSQYGIVMDVSSNTNWVASSDQYFTTNSSYTNSNGTVVNKTAGWAIACENDSCTKGVYDAHYLVGNYYQWLAATAQTEEQGADAPVDGTPVTTSICPYDWQLPSAGSMNNEKEGSFYNLLQNYVAIGSNDGVDATYNSANEPLFFTHAGIIDTPRATLRDGITIGNYWSSATATLTTRARYFGFNMPITSANPGAVDRNYGFSLRCLVLSTENQ